MSGHPSPEEDEFGSRCGSGATGGGTPLTERLAAAVEGTAQPVTAADRAELGELLPLVERYAEGQQFNLGADRWLAIAVHALAFVRRVRESTYLEEFSAEIYAEVPAERLSEMRQLMDVYCTPRDYPAPDAEVLLFALHFEAARQQGAEETTRGARP